MCVMESRSHTMITFDEPLHEEATASEDIPDDGQPDVGMETTLLRSSEMDNFTLT